MTTRESAGLSRVVASTVLVVALGGALGAVARWALGEVFPAAPPSFPWTIFAINVVGCGLLASLPALPVVRRRPLLPAFLGPGVLGGFTTLSSASEQTVTLLHAGRTGLAAAYCLGSLGAALVAVLLVDRASTALQRDRFASEGGDE